jgi:hypothetical protein
MKELYDSLKEGIGDLRDLVKKSDFATSQRTHSDGPISITPAKKAANWKEFF